MKEKKKYLVEGVALATELVITLKQLIQEGKEKGEAKAPKMKEKFDLMLDKIYDAVHQKSVANTEKMMEAGNGLEWNIWTFLALLIFLKIMKLSYIPFLVIGGYVYQLCKIPFVGIPLFIIGITISFIVYTLYIGMRITLSLSRVLSEFVIKLSYNEGLNAGLKMAVALEEKVFFAISDMAFGVINRIKRGSNLDAGLEPNSEVSE